jgi:TrmH family RNA methyltransferase
MLSKSEAKYIQSLCHKKQRQEEGLFIAEGPKLLEELISSNYQIHKLYALGDFIANNKQQLDNMVEVSEAELEKISSLQSPNKVLAIVQQKEALMPNIAGKMSLMLDGIQDPGNLGTIIRIADWFGIGNIICSHDTAELYNPKVIQSTMGSFVRVNVWYGQLEEFLSSNQVPVYGTLLRGKSIYEMDKPKEAVLVIGNEGKGIREDVLPFVKHPVTIPRMGGAESLNAAVATGIILSHLV